MSNGMKKNSDQSTLQVARGDTEPLEDYEDHCNHENTTRSSTNASQPGADFAGLYPVNDAAKLAFDDIACAIESDSQWNSHARKFIHIDDVKKVMRITPEDEDLDSDAESQEVIIRTGHFRLSLDILPAHFALGWVIGSGRTDLAEPSVDLLLTRRGRRHDVRGRHAQLLFHRESRVLMLKVLKNKRVILNGQELTDCERMLSETQMGLTLGNLTYRLQFAEANNTHRDQLNDLLKESTIWQKGRYASLDPTPSAAHFTFQGYSFQSPIDAGSYGVVMPCVRILDGRAFAVKRIQRKQYTFKTVKDELDILSSLGKHRHICSLVETLYSGGDGESMGKSRVNDIYMVIEPLASERTFDSFMASNANNSDRTTAFHQVGQGLAYIHSCHILHRDIKPANLLIAERHPIRVVVADFGCSTTDMKSKEHWKGTVEYLPPEILALKPKEHRKGTLEHLPLESVALEREVVKNIYWSPESDVFSYGVVGYELFHTRFRRPSQGIDEAAHEDMMNTLNTSQTEMDDLLCHMLSWSQMKRPTMQQILNMSLWPDPEIHGIGHKRKYDSK